MSPLQQLKALQPIIFTPWYPAELRPHRPGIYQVRTGDSTWYSYWNGTEWSVSVQDLHTLDFVRNVPSELSEKVWRGLNREVV